MSKDHVAADPLDHHEHAPGQGPLGENANVNENVNETPQPGDEIDPPSPARGVPKRVDPGAAPQRIIKPGHLDEELGGLKEAALEEPGWYGGARPKSAEQRLRAGVPYSTSAKFSFDLVFFPQTNETIRRIQVCNDSTHMWIGSFCEILTILFRMRKGFRYDEF